MSEPTVELDAAYWRTCLLGVDDFTEVGIHPQSVNGVPRDAYKDGWNAAVMKSGERFSEYLTLCLHPTPEWRMKAELIAGCQCFFGYGEAEDERCLCLLMNDVFYWACADAEPVSDEELPEVYRLWKEHGSNGPLAWTCWKRKQDPQTPYLAKYGESYRKALKAIYGVETAGPSAE